MKKLIALLLFVPLFISCSSDDDNNGYSQDYTSFVFYHTSDVNLPNCVAAYKRSGKYYKIAGLGALSKGKYSPEIKLTDNSIDKIYLFSDYNGVIRFDDIFQLQKFEKNSFLIEDGTKGIRITDKDDPTQYPQ